MVFEALEDGRLTMGKKLKVSRRAAGQTPSRLGLRAGKSIRTEDAILGVVTKSANDAATVLAEALARSEADFARDMTQRARELGMSRTSFRNATGLPNRRQRTTARDMATLGLAIQRDFPQYYSYFARASFKWGKRVHRNHNNLLRGYRGTDGIKTGYIRASGFNLVASVERNGVRLIGVVFGGRTARSRDRHMISLLDSAFAKRDKRIAAVTGKKPVAKVKPKSQLAKLQPAGPGVTPPKKPTLPNKKTNTADDPQSKVVAAKDPTGKWGVEVGTFRRYASAERRIHQVAKLAPNLLMHKGVNILPVTQNKRTLYKARLTELDKRDARKACRVLHKRKLACRVMSPRLLQVAMN
jgi:D-alanyl-D-alanine carboxypeptidase